MTNFTLPQTATDMDLLVAFFDLSHFAREVQGKNSREIFNTMSDYYEFVGDIVEKAGGAVVKFIGDVTLAVFPEDCIDDGVLALKAVREQGDAYLSDRGMRSHHVIKAHFGTVTCGAIGTHSLKRFDVFGEIVNIAARLTSNSLAITPQVFRKLAPETRKHFKKHTPPVTYIPIEESHRD